MRRFVLRGTPNAYRLVSTSGERLETWNGVEGTAGERRSRHLATPAVAESHSDRLAAAAVADGYEEFDAPVAPADSRGRTLAMALADAVADDPDDLAAVMAEADYLTEQGDPRGEFVAVQLALEDESRPTAERDDLRTRDFSLLFHHEGRWLGELARYVVGSAAERRAAYLADLTPHDRPDPEGDEAPEGAAVRLSWSRGRIDTFECESLTVNLARALGRHPLARSLRVLNIDTDTTSTACEFDVGPDVPDLFFFLPVELLRAYPVLRNLRAFRLGTMPDPEADVYRVGLRLPESLPALLAAMPRLEELSLFGYANFGEFEADVFALSTLTNLRSLTWYHALDYPLGVLAANPALARLERLSCYPHRGARSRESGRPAINLPRLTTLTRSPHLRSLTHLQLRCCDGGDEAIEELIESGMLGRLTALDLRHGLVTDAGARLLASNRGRLESLDLVNNRLTPDGVEVLRRAGIRVRAERQQVPPFDGFRVDYYGDSE